ncbi:30S ribosomal protein S7 [Candidatus Nesciobacter abundans]|uniref:Small ribosomal subunit protein uS7 n=1 Tax=Candidatus Nesciobacter abundans TaxID=2601668 RepID=A0A5C0UGG0_9PROT|nr:30S ribosomal protein S7 [Candidatus Nesciobacter abundans]QEK38899.1 30S ribosomal protein S7 [Candidatus Nesciobacter abundans]
MSRKGKIQKREVRPDSKYSNKRVAMLINKVMQDGKKEIAEKIVYTAMESIAEELNVESVKVVDDVIDNLRPNEEVRQKKVAGHAYTVPFEVDEGRSIMLALRWLVENARKRTGIPMHEKLRREMKDALNSTGGAFKKKEDSHKQADANRAYQHYGAR